MLGLPEGELLGDGLLLGLDEGDADGLAEGLPLLELLGLLEGLGLEDGLVLGEADLLDEGELLGLVLGDADGDGELDGDADGLPLGELLGEGELDGEALGLADGLADGEVLGDDDPVEAGANAIAIMPQSSLVAAVQVGVTVAGLETSRVPPLPRTCEVNSNRSVSVEVVMSYPPCAPFAKLTTQALLVIVVMFTDSVVP